MDQQTINTESSFTVGLHTMNQHNQQQDVELAQAALSKLLQHMGFDASVTVSNNDAERIELEVVGPDAELLAGNKGETLDALQLIVNKMVGRQLDISRPVSIDAAGYRERREESLIELARRLSEKARQSGQVVALNPMSASDRRIIHMTLKEEPGVTTRSEGDGIDRRLLIIPEA